MDGVKQVGNVVVYCKQKQNESTEATIERVNKLIQQLESYHKIKGVFLDSSEERTELNELLNFNLSSIDYMYIGSKIDDEFDSQLIKELSRTEQFEVIFFD